MAKYLSARFQLARLLTRPLPPLAAQRLRTLILPLHVASALGEIEARSFTGSPLRVSLGDFHGYPFAIHGYFEWRNVVLAAALVNEGGCIVEVGANVGTETVGFADVVGRRGCVFAIEPDTANLARLHQLATRVPQVQVVAAVAAATTGTRRFLPPPDATATGIGYVTEHGTLDVSAVTVDDTVGARPISVIFTDTEGFEIEVLQGSRRVISRDRPCIVVEANERHLSRGGSSMDDLLALLNEFGYSWRGIGRWGLTSSLEGSGNLIALPLDRQLEFRRLHRVLLGALVTPPATWPWVLRSRVTSADSARRTQRRSKLAKRLQSSRSNDEHDELW